MRQANTPGAGPDLSRGRPYWTRVVIDNHSNEGPNIDEEEYLHLGLQTDVPRDTDDEAVLGDQLNATLKAKL